MFEPDQPGLSHRLDSFAREVLALRAQVRDMRRAGLAALVLAPIAVLVAYLAGGRSSAPATGSPATVPAVVAAGAFELRGADGKPRAILSIDANPGVNARTFGPSLKFLDDRGRERARIGLDGRGFGGVLIDGPEELARIQLVGADQAGLFLYDEKGNARFGLEHNAGGGSPFLHFLDDRERSRFLLHLDGDGRPEIEAMPKAGDPVLLHPGAERR